MSEDETNNISNYSDSGTVDDVGKNNADITDITDNVDANSVEDEEDNNPDEPDQKITKEFHENVIKYVKLDDLIRKKEAEIRELKNSKKPCEKFILDHLDKLGENIIEITNGKLRKNKAESKVPLTADIIKDTLLDKLANAELVDELMKTMDKSRPKMVRVNLKRTSGKK